MGTGISTLEQLNTDHWGDSMVVFKLDLVGPALAGRAVFLTKKI
jgi:hypothetical protein